MTETALSICITTRNRCSFLEKTLSALLAQATQATARVEIVVLDAASEDGTRQVCEAHASGNRQMSYFRQESNQGIDRDYAGAAERARGEYVWFMSDDDLPSEGAVEAVLQACREGHALVVANAEDWNADFTERIGGPRLPLRENRVFGPDRFVELFEAVGGFLSFIPGVVVRKDVWDSREKEAYYGSFFAHIGVLFQARLPGTALVIAEPLVRIRNGNISWAGRSFEIWMVKWPSLISSLSALPPASRLKVSSPEPWRNPEKLLEFRAMGAYSLEHYRKWIVPGNPPGSVRAMAFIVAVTPGILVNSLCLGYFLLFAREKRIPLFHLKTSRFYIGKRPL